MFTAHNKSSSIQSSATMSRKKILSVLVAASMVALSGLSAPAWSKPAPTGKTAAVGKTSANKAAVDKKKTGNKENVEKASARRKTTDAATTTAKNKTNPKTARLRNNDDDEDVRPARRDRKNIVVASQKNTRPLTKAQKLAAEKQAKMLAAEQARQERFEAAQAARLAAAKREKQEAARQLQLTRQKQLAQEAQATALPATKATAPEEDLIALQLAKSEAALQASAEAAPATLPAASSATATVAAAAIAPVPAPVATAPAVAATVVARTTPATAPTPATVAPEPAIVAAAPAVATPAAAARKAAEADSAIVRVSAPAREVYRPSQRLSSIRPGDAPDLYSSVAFVMDQNTGQVLLNKNGHQAAPIASITKLMTAVITMDANLPMDELITITSEDVDRVKRSSSRLAVGSTLSRQELLHLALMSSENRAAHALGRTYPGGMSEAVRAMNLRALMLGMRNTRYVEPTGLSSANQSSAHDLAQLVKAAYRYPLIRNYTTYPGSRFPVLGQMTNYNNTNRLVYSSEWNIGLQKTGFISEAGRCVVMQSNIAGRNIIIVLLDSNNSNRRAEDAEAIRDWVQNGITPSPAPNDAQIVVQLAASS